MMHVATRLRPWSRSPRRLSQPHFRSMAAEIITSHECSFVVMLLQLRIVLIAVAAFVCVCCSRARAQLITALNYPGSTNTQFTGVDGDYVVGTANSGGFVYDIATSTWSPVSQILPIAVSGGVAAGYGSGSSSDLYNIATGQTTPLPSTITPAALSGAYVVSGNHLFEYVNTVSGNGGFSLYNLAAGTTTSASINDSELIGGISGNTVVGEQITPTVIDGFSYNISTGRATTYTYPVAASDPGPAGTAFTGVAGNLIVGFYEDSLGIHGFEFNTSTNTWTPLRVVPAAISSDGQTIIGSFGAYGSQSGFVSTLPVVTANVANWSGGSVGSWNSPANWNSNLGAVPAVAGDIATINSSGGAVSVTLDANQTLGQLTLSGGKGVTISQGSGGSLDLGYADGSAAGAVIAAAGNNAINAPVVAAGALSVSNNPAHSQLGFFADSGASLAVNGVVSDGTNQGAVLIGGGGTVALNAPNTFSGGVNLAGATLIIGNTSALGTGPLSFGTGPSVIDNAAGVPLSVQITSTSLYPLQQITFEGASLSLVAPAGTQLELANSGLTADVASGASVAMVGGVLEPFESGWTFTLTGGGTLSTNAAAFGSPNVHSLFVNGGELVISNSASTIGRFSQATVAGGAVLAPQPGNGTIDTFQNASMTLQAGATLDLRDGAIGTCAIASLASTAATLGFDLGASGADQIKITNAPSLNGANTIVISPFGSNLSPNQTDNLITAPSGLNTGGTFQFADGLPTEIVTLGGNTYTLGLQNSAVAESIRVSSGATAGGGPTSIGGGGATFTNITTPGAFTDTFLEPTTPVALQQAIGESAAGEINFVLPSQTVQLWELGFTGGFSGDATVTLHFDPTLIGNTPLSDLYIEHYENGVWVVPPNQTVDFTGDTITFETDGFSPFILAAVPEPSSLLLVMIGFVAIACSLWRGKSAAWQTLGTH